MSFVKKIIDSIGDDKKDHVLLGKFVGYPCMIIGLTLDVIFKVHYFTFILSSFALAFLAWKEIVYDWMKGKGNPEWNDFWAGSISILWPLLFYTAAILQ